MYKRIRLEHKSLFAFLITIMMAMFHILSSYTSGSVVIFAIALLVFLGNSIIHGNRMVVRITRLHVLILLFGLFCFLSQFWAYNSSYARIKGVTILEMLIFVTLLYPCLSEIFSVDDLLSCFKWSGFIVVVGAFFYYGIGTIVSSILQGTRIPSTYLNSNVLGMLSATTIIISVYEIIKDGFKVSDLLGIACVVIIAASGSRKAIIALVSGVIAIYILMNRDKDLSKRIIGLLIGFLLLLGLFYLAYALQLFAGVNQRIQYLVNMIMGEGPVDNSALVRQQLIKIGMEQFKQTPYFGMGIDNTRFLSISYLNYDFYLHNNYVELLAGVGIVGFLLYYMIYADVIVNMIKYRKYKETSYYAVFVILLLRLVMDYGSVSYYSKETYMNFILFFILLERLEQNKKIMQANGGITL